MGIPELKKPKDEWCPNFAAGIGCRIYADRPPSCHNFVCQWLSDPTMGPEWKPSVCKMVLDTKPKLMVVHVDPAATKPWRAEPYFSVLKRLAVQGAAKGVLVMVIERHRTIVILPDREVDMGMIGPGARVEIKRTVTPGGIAWEPRVIGAAENGKAG
jgi:hypothetical protein